MSWSHTDGLLLKIKDGDKYVDMPVPSKYDVTYQDLSSKDAGRNMDGRMYKCKIDPNGTARTIDLEWKNASKEDGELVLATVGTNEYMLVKFYDPFKGGYETGGTGNSEGGGIWFYAGDRKSSIVMIKKTTTGTGSNITTSLVPVYTISVTLIEVDPVNNEIPESS